MNNKLKGIYRIISPTKGEDDWNIYQQYSVYGKSVDEIAFEFDREPSSIYRAIKRVAKFLKSDLNYYDLENMICVIPHNAGIRGVESAITYKIVYIAIAVFYSTGEEYLDKFYCNYLQSIHPCIKNKKKEIMEEMKNAHWYFWDTKTKVYIFDSFVFSRNRIDFQINDLVRIMLLSAKNDI